MQNNFDNNTMNNIKNLVEKGNISQAISQISPEMIDSFSKILNSNSDNSNMSNNHTNLNNSNCNYNNSDNQSYNNHNSISSTNPSTSANYNNFKTNDTSSNSSQSNSFNFGNMDINTIMKMKTIMEKMNNNNDPSHNLLNSLKPYLRESKKEKIDQYANLLNFSKIAEELNFNNKTNNNNT